MARKDKLFQKIQNNPRNARFADVRQLLLLDQIVVLTKERAALPEYQVKDALKALIALKGDYE